jgi:uridine kinase
VRDAVLAEVAALLVARPAAHPWRVAVDGITAGGKSTFAAELTSAIACHGRPAIHLSTDDFHHQRAHRRRDPDPARGYYRDAYDLVAFRTLVLDPLGPGGDRRYRRRRHDLQTDELIDEPPAFAPADAIVVVDGSFLQSAELSGGWDDVIYLEVAYEVALGRAVVRDDALFGGADAVRVMYADRYHAACRMYVADVDPARSAAVVVDNDDLEFPVVVRGV